MRALATRNAAPARRAVRPADALLSMPRLTRTCRQTTRAVLTATLAPTNQRGAAVCPMIHSGLVASAALDVDRLAGDEARTQEPHHRVDDVIGLAVASGEGPMRALAQQGGLLVTQAIPCARVHDTGRDGIDPYRRQIRRQVARGVLDRPFVTPLTSDPGPGRQPTTPENSTIDPVGRRIDAKCLATSIGPTAFAVNAASSFSRSSPVARTSCGAELGRFSPSALPSRPRASTPRATARRTPHHAPPARPACPLAIRRTSMPERDRPAPHPPAAMAPHQEASCLSPMCRHHQQVYLS